jgi:hypothetical protein
MKHDRALKSRSIDGDLAWMSGEISHVTEQRRALALSEIIVAALAIVMLLVAQWMLTVAIHGSNYYGVDGKMAQATILAALKYSGLFQVNSISPIEGVGSQLLTMNVWANPAYWPFAVLDKEVATDVSALVALGIFMIACYVMMRCFDVPVVPSAIAAQLCILLFAPTLLILRMPTNFCLTPGAAVLYAPFMVALGLLTRLETGSWRHFSLITGAIFLTLLYSIYLDPLWAMVNGISWAVAFGIVTISPFRRKTILLRAVALSCIVAVLVVSGVAEYLYTLSQYTFRVQFPAVSDRPRTLALATAAGYSPNIMPVYGACAVGWLLGLLMGRGRPRVVAAAAAASFCVFVAYSAVYLLLLDAVWVPPIPIYIEHSLFVLYIAGAVAGYWSVLQQTVWLVSRLAAAAVRRGAVGNQATAAPPSQFRQLFGANAWIPRSLSRPVTIGGALLIVSVIPAKVVDYALHDSADKAEIYNLPWPNEPELMQFFSDNIGALVGEPLRGSVSFFDVKPVTHFTITNTWAHGLHTIEEYSQLVTPQAIYFLYALLDENVTGMLNGFVPYPGPSAQTFWKTLEMFGVRYRVYANAMDIGYPVFTLPRRPLEGKEGLWYVYELPNPNVGDYSPTQIATAQSAAEIIAKIKASDFDFTRQAVLSAPIEAPLVSARDMRLSRIRGGLHVSGQSDRTSLVVLPLQFSNCLRALDGRVRFVRANLLMAGMIFSGRIDTDIVFDYGLFSPSCRWADLADFKRLAMKIDLRMPHLMGNRLFLGWNGAMAKFREAGVELGLLPPTAPEGGPQTPSEESAPSGPVVTEETTLERLPQTNVPGFEWIGLQGLNAEAVSGERVVTGQPIMTLVAVPTDGRHYLAAQTTGLDRNRVYRVTAWVKAAVDVKLEVELRDGVMLRNGRPANYGIAVFDPATRLVASSSAGLKERGVEEGLDGWQKVWVDLATTDGQFVLALGVVSRDRRLFKGDGRSGLTFGGIQVAPRD